MGMGRDPSEVGNGGDGVMADGEKGEMVAKKMRSLLLWLMRKIGQHFELVKW